MTNGVVTLMALEEKARLAALEKEVAHLREENEILKKATAYFAKESLPGTRS